MNKNRWRYRFFSVLVSLALLPAALSAQFLNMQIEVDPEVEIMVERPLNFGQIIANTGLVQIDLGHPGMGIFAIRAIRTQRMLLSLRQSGHLDHPDLDEQIPVELMLAYNDFGVNDFRESKPVDSDFEEIVLQPSPENPDSTWSTAYLYVFGNINVANIPAGMYTGDAVLHIEYE